MPLGQDARPPGDRSAREHSESIADRIDEQVRRLPEPLAREVLDFVASLTERIENRDWRGLMEAQGQGLISVWDNPDDRVWDDA